MRAGEIIIVGVLRIVVLLALALRHSFAFGADAVLTLGTQLEVQDESASVEAAQGSRIPLSLGTEQDGASSVTIPGGGIVVPLLRTEGVPPWLAGEPALLRVLPGGGGSLTGKAEASDLLLAARVQVEAADGHVLATFDVELQSEIPKEYVPGSELKIRVAARSIPRPGEGSRSFSGQIAGALGEAQP